MVYDKTRDPDFIDKMKREQEAQKIKDMSEEESAMLLKKFLGGGG